MGGGCIFVSPIVPYINAENTNRNMMSAPAYLLDAIYGSSPLRCCNRPPKWSWVMSDGMAIK